MKLTKEQKETLQSLKKHPWYAVLELIEEQRLQELWIQLLNMDLTDSKNIERMQKEQIYAQARRDFLLNVTSHTTDNYIPSVPTWYEE